MSNTAIRVENLSKAYKIGKAGKRYKTLREDLVGLLKQPFSRQTVRSTELFYALNDVSFELKQGEVLGIIGRNGAGKSTLLKILSRITPPTAGQAEVYGRVGSLLEVGTGFHPELTGRENIFLNGAILGMTRREIQRKFDEIVDFAEVEQFLDTPVKRYSSGMYVRLAFAVAAHLEPEILVVDEVLAVGDSRFQEKCLGKMNAVAHEGRTVLFVSHNMATVQQLCRMGLLLEAGKVVFQGQIEETIARYTRHTANIIEDNALGQRRDRKGDQSLRFERAVAYNNEDKSLERILSGQNIWLRFYYKSAKTYNRAAVNIAFNVYNSQGVLLTNLNSKDTGQSWLPVGNEGYFECSWPRFNLRSGVYFCTLYCEINGTIVDWIQSAFQLNVEDGDFFNSGSLVERSQGDILVEYQWSSQVDTEVRR